MSTTVKQTIFSLSTIVWGVTPLYFYTTGLVAAYLAPSFHLISLIGGLAMVVLGLFNLLTARQVVDCGHDHDHHDHEHEHEHGQSPLAAIALMIVPVVIAIFATQHEYSARALAWKGLYKARSANSTLYTTHREKFTRESLEKSALKTEDGHFKLQLTELFFSAGDTEIMEVYGGIPAQLEGRIIAEEDKLNPNGNRKRLYRVFMQCCAADANVFGIPIEFEGPLPDFPDRSWVVVDGTVSYEKSNGQDQAYLKVTRIESAPEASRQNPFGR